MRSASLAASAWMSVGSTGSVDAASITVGVGAEVGGPHDRRCWATSVGVPSKIIRPKSST